MTDAKEVAGFCEPCMSECEFGCAPGFVFYEEDKSCFPKEWCVTPWEEVVSKDIEGVGM